MKRLREDNNGNLHTGGVWTADGFIPKKIVRATPIGNPRAIFEGERGFNFDEFRPKGANAYKIDRDTTPPGWVSNLSIRRSYIVVFYRIKPRKN
jgi:hypothetical protein